MLLPKLLKYNYFSLYIPSLLPNFQDIVPLGGADIIPLDRDCADRISSIFKTPGSGHGGGPHGRVSEYEPLPPALKKRRKRVEDDMGYSKPRRKRRRKMRHVLSTTEESSAAEDHTEHRWGEVKG